MHWEYVPALAGNAPANVIGDSRDLLPILHLRNLFLLERKRGSVPGLALNSVLPAFPKSKEVGRQGVHPRACRADDFESVRGENRNQLALCPGALCVCAKRHAQKSTASNKNDLQDIC